MGLNWKNTIIIDSWDSLFTLTVMCNTFFFAYFILIFGESKNQDLGKRKDLAFSFDKKKKKKTFCPREISNAKHLIAMWHFGQCLGLQMPSFLLKLVGNAITPSLCA